MAALTWRRGSRETRCAKEAGTPPGAEAGRGEAARPGPARPRRRPGQQLGRAGGAAAARNRPPKSAKKGDLAHQGTFVQRAVKRQSGPGRRCHPPPTKATRGSVRGERASEASWGRRGKLLRACLSSPPAVLLCSPCCQVQMPHSFRSWSSVCHTPR